MLNNYFKNSFLLEKYHLNYYILKNFFFEIKKLKLAIFNFLIQVYLNWFLVLFYLIFKNKVSLKLKNSFLIFYVFKKPGLEYFIAFKKNFLKKFSVLRSPFVYKKAWDQFEFFQRRLVFFINFHFFTVWYFNFFFQKNFDYLFFSKKSFKKKVCFIISLK